MPFIYDIFRIFFPNLFQGFPSGRKGASQTVEFLGLPGVKEQKGILQRKCVDMRGVSG